MTISSYRPGEEITAARLNQVVAAALQNIVGGNGIQVTRVGNGIRIGLERPDRGVPPGAVNPGGVIGTDNYGTFVYVDGTCYTIGVELTADGTWYDLNTGYSNAKAMLLAIVHSGSANPQFRRAAGAGFAVATLVNSGYTGYCVVVPAAAGVFQYNFGSGDSGNIYIGGYWT